MESSSVSAFSTAINAFTCALSSVLLQVPKAWMSIVWLVGVGFVAILLSGDVLWRCLGVVVLCVELDSEVLIFRAVVLLTFPDGFRFLEELLIMLSAAARMLARNLLATESVRSVAVGSSTAQEGASSNIVNGTLLTDFQDIVVLFKYSGRDKLSF